MILRRNNLRNKSPRSKVTIKNIYESTKKYCSERKCKKKNLDNSHNLYKTNKHDKINKVLQIHIIDIGKINKKFPHMKDLCNSPVNPNLDSTIFKNGLKSTITKKSVSKLEKQDLQQRSEKILSKNIAKKGKTKTEQKKQKSMSCNDETRYSKKKNFNAEKNTAFKSTLYLDDLNSISEEDLSATSFRTRLRSSTSSLSRKVSILEKNEPCRSRSVEVSKPRASSPNSRELSKVKSRQKKQSKMIQDCKNKKKGSDASKNKSNKASHVNREIKTDDLTMDNSKISYDSEDSLWTQRKNDSLTVRRSARKKGKPSISDSELSIDGPTVNPDGFKNTKKKSTQQCAENIEKRPNKKSSRCKGDANISKKIIPGKGSLKRKRWMMSTLKNGNEGQEDDFFGNRYLDAYSADDSDLSDVSIATPKNAFLITPINKSSKTPRFKDCYSPTEYLRARKVAEEYMHRRNKKKRNCSNKVSLEGATTASGKKTVPMENSVEDLEKKRLECMEKINNLHKGQNSTGLNDDSEEEDDYGIDVSF